MTVACVEPDWVGQLSGRRSAGLAETLTARRSAREVVVVLVVVARLAVVLVSVTAVVLGSLLATVVGALVVVVVTRGTDVVDLAGRLVEGVVLVRGRCVDADVLSCVELAGELDENGGFRLRPGGSPASGLSVESGAALETDARELVVIERRNSDVLAGRERTLVSASSSPGLPTVSAIPASSRAAPATATQSPTRRRRAWTANGKPASSHEYREAMSCDASVVPSTWASTTSRRAGGSGRCAA